MKQFHRFKKQHPGCVLFFRMGDFYEMFYDDAQLAHKVLGVTLTQRTKGIPMAGVPYHAVESYLRRMIQAGHRVAVCDQIQDPSEAKGVVDRDVTRVITPGTLTDESLLEESSENPLAAVVFHSDEHASLAWAELSTGAFSVASLKVGELLDELSRIAPSELLFCETATGDTPPRIERLTAALGCPATGRPAWQFRQSEATQILKRQYQVAQLAGFGFDDEEMSLAAAGAIVHYLLETQKTAGDGRLSHLRPPRRFTRQNHLVIDHTSLRSLEVERTLRTGQTDGSLLGSMQSCVTAMGKRRLRHWLCYPLADRASIEQRQAVVASLVADDRFLDDLRDTLDAIHDVPRIIARLSVNRALPRDLVGLARSARSARAVADLLADRDTVAGYHQRAVALVDPLTNLANELETACVDSPPAHMREGGLIREGYDAQLDEARHLQRDSNAWLSRYQKSLAEQAGIPSLKVGYNKVFGYYIEVTAANRDKAPDSWTRKQTLKNAERYITPELKEFEGKVLSAQSRAVSREQTLFADLCAKAQACIDPLHEFAELTAELDVLAAFARHATRHRYVRPTIVDEPVLEIFAGRHPVLDQMLGDQFVPNDVALGTQADHADAPATLAMITGPNMAGKSTYIRQTALIALLAHTGAFVPAERATVGLCDRIFTRIGASDELHAGQSTFMVEMTETANICHHATDRSLIILDEIGRGTSTLDGLSLAWAIAEYLAAKKPRTLFATHYHELTSLAEQFPNIANFNVTVREWQDEIVFLHRIVAGATDRSYGIHVAKIAGLPRLVVDRAHALLSQLAVNHAPAPNRSAAAAGGPSPQMSLFTEYVEHPAHAELRELSLESLTPLAAFDALRQLQQRAKND